VLHCVSGVSQRGTLIKFLLFKGLQGYSEYLYITLLNDVTISHIARVITTSVFGSRNAVSGFETGE
jgi:hypothetical protein